MMTSLATIGAACRPMSDITRSIVWSSSFFKSTTPFSPNVSTRRAGLRVEGDQAIPGSDVENSRVGPVGPVGEASSGQPPRRTVAARAFVLAVHPQQFPGGGVERHDRTPRARGGIQDAADHQRRRLEIEFRTRPERIGLEAPGDFELAEVGRGDLIERGVARAGEVAAVGAPFAGRRTGLAGHVCSPADGYGCHEDQYATYRTRRNFMAASLGESIPVARIYDLRFGDLRIYLPIRSRDRCSDRQILRSLDVQTRSIATATPLPPPRHRLAMPRVALRRLRA